MIKFEFHIADEGDPSVGIMPLDDVVTIKIKDGPVDTEDINDLKEHLRESLAEWYDISEVVDEDEYQQSLAEENALFDRCEADDSQET